MKKDIAIDKEIQYTEQVKDILNIGKRIEKEQF